MSEEKALVDTTEIDNTIQDLAAQVLAETDPDKAKDLISLFNWNLSKKNVSRVLKLNSLYDDVSDQMVERFHKKADQFTNSDLLDYLKVVQGAIDTSSKNLTQVEEPPAIVQHNNTQINVNLVDAFDRNAKQRILDAIQATIKNAAKPPVVEIPAEDIEETEEGNTPDEH